MRNGTHRTRWLGAAVIALLAGPARAEGEDPRALMRAALEAQLDAHPAPPELPTQAAAAPVRGRERAAEAHTRMAAKRAVSAPATLKPESASVKIRAARAADQVTTESVSPGTRRAHGKTKP